MRSILHQTLSTGVGVPPSYDQTARAWGVHVRTSVSSLRTNKS